MFCVTNLPRPEKSVVNPAPWPTTLRFKLKLGPDWPNFGPIRPGHDAINVEQAAALEELVRGRPGRADAGFGRCRCFGVGGCARLARRRQRSDAPIRARA